MALKDAGVKRARLGDCEFEFPVELETQPATVPTAPETVVMTPTTKPTPAVEARPGYAMLFGDRAPRFKAAD